MKRPSLSALKESIGNLQALKDREKIPAHKRKAQWLKSFFGGVVFVGGFFLPKFLGFPWQVGVVVAGFGGFMASQGLVLDYLKAVPQAVSAIAAALTGKQP